MMDLARAGKSIMPRLFDNMVRQRNALERIFEQLVKTGSTIFVDIISVHTTTGLGYNPRLNPDYVIKEKTTEDQGESSEV